MLIHLSEILTREDMEKAFEVPFEGKTFEGPEGVYPVVSSEPIRIVLKNLGSKKLSLTGGTSVTLRIPCARCLEPVDYKCDLEFDEELDMRLSDEERVRELDEQSYLSGFNLDADQLVCNELLVSLPMKVLCKEDCKGICNRCGANLNYETCSCDTRSLDPRMAVIQDIFKQFKEV